MNLVYHHDAQLEDLVLNECVVRPCAEGDKNWLMLWFLVARETDGVIEVFGVAINPGGGSSENGPGGRTWGFAHSGPNTWQVSPSINVLEDEIHQGPHPDPAKVSVWHQTPTVVGVSDPEPWATSAPTP